MGVPSRQTGLLRVEPGNPDDSYLIRKLEGTASEGDQMPLGGPPLPQSTIDFARQWITDGALPDDDGPTGQPPTVTSLDPAPGSVLSSIPQSIEVGFDREIDASTINSETFTLVASGGDGSFEDGNEAVITPVSVSLSTINPRLATMDLGGVSGSEDQYRVTLRGSGASFVMSADGLRLDGKFSGAFPSGDGAEGGDFVAGFSIEGLQPTLDSIQANVFEGSCALSGCHDGGGTGLPRGMDLSSADASFDALVGVDSLQVPGLPRVTPNDADASYLVDKLEGTQADELRQMPQGGPLLDQATIDVIRAWIDNGARTMSGRSVRLMWVAVALLPLLALSGAWRPRTLPCRPEGPEVRDLPHGPVRRRAANGVRQHLRTNGNAGPHARPRQALGWRDRPLFRDRRRRPWRLARDRHAGAAVGVGDGAAGVPRVTPRSGLFPDYLSFYIDARLAPDDVLVRKQYVRAKLPSGKWALRYGEFFLPFGWRLQDDDAFIRVVGGINYNTPDRGFELQYESAAWSAQLAVTRGTAGGPEVDSGKQYSLE